MARNEDAPSRARLAWLLAALPWAWPVLLFAYASVTAISFGHWPSYGNPDPKQAGAISILRDPGWVLLILALGSPMLMGFRFLSALLLGQKLAPLMRPLIVLVVGWLLSVALFAFDLFGLANWWMD
jgi:hypothetical protein